MRYQAEPGNDAWLAVVLRDNLIYQSAIMVQICVWLEQLLIGHEALDLGAGPTCLEELARADAALEQIPALAEEYCQGEWENWYRGCRKLNITASCQRTGDVLDLARQTLPGPASPAGR